MFRENLIPTASADRRLKPQEAAAQINMSLAFIRKHIFLKTIKYEKFGRSVRIPASALAEFIRNQQGGIR